MKLEDLDLLGYGHFGKAKASFTLDTLNLPAPWEYIYQNRRMLLKLDQHGPVYAQAEPPSDIMLFRRDPFQRYASWLVWFSSPSFKHGSFTNFFRPLQGRTDPAAKPDFFRADFFPHKAVYTVENEGLKIITEFFVPRGEPAIVMKVRLSNLTNKTLKVSAVPALRPFFNSVLTASWDKPEWYLKTAFCLEKQAGISLQLMNPKGDKTQRRTGVLWSDRENLTGAELRYESFAGQGSFENPEAIHAGKLRLSLSAARPWGIYDKGNLHTGYPHASAFRYEYTITAGESRGFTQVLSMLEPDKNGLLPALAAAEKPARWLNDRECKRETEEIEKESEKLFSARNIKTPDAALNRYVNEWLPLQLDWTCSLDRGWPTGMRGCRDAANDFIPMIPLAPGWAKETIKTLFSCQRQDGWIPRGIAAKGRKGIHDLRNYVDAGNFLLELFYEYLCFTRDFAFLSEKLPWLESDEESTLLSHALKAASYYFNPGNIGEHGLCKIGEGDWLDALNRAGIKGRGESVTVTNQTIISLRQLSSLLELLASREKYHGLLPAGEIKTLLSLYSGKMEELKNALLKHALNKEGYFNSVFNDDGAWLYSDKDPDGERRIYGPANWFALTSGVAIPGLVDNLMNEMDKLKCSAGYRLCWPPMGKKPIANTGRVGSGDLTAFRSENATAYNHGSHGFLGRGLASAGKGDRLFDVIQYLLPYDQERHPLKNAMTPPYGVVNCWQELPGFPFRGGMNFLTGSIAYGLRMVYDWMFGIRPLLSGLAIDPCIPKHFKKIEANFSWRGSAVHLIILNQNAEECSVKGMQVDGKNITVTETDSATGRTLFIAADGFFKAGGKHEIRVRL